MMSTGNAVRTMTRALAVIAFTGIALVLLYLLMEQRNADLIGAWRGNAGGLNVSLELKENGKGFGKLGPVPEQPLTWTAEDNKVILRLGDTPENDSKGGSGNAAGPGANLVGTLAQDRQSMTVDIGVVHPTLYKAAQ